MPRAVAATRNQERGTKQILSEPPRRDQHCPHRDLGLGNSEQHPRDAGGMWKGPEVSEVQRERERGFEGLKMASQDTYVIT